MPKADTDITTPELRPVRTEAQAPVTWHCFHDCSFAADAPPCRCMGAPEPRQ